MAKAINFDAQWLAVNSPGVANTEFSVSHKLKRIPAGMIIARRSDAGIVRFGSTVNTTTVVNFTSNTALARYLILIF